MKNTILLNKLLRIEQNGSVNLDPDFLALLAEVKQEVYNEEKTFSSDQKRASKKALAFLTKIKKQNQGHEIRLNRDQYIITMVEADGEGVTFHGYIQRSMWK